MRTFKLFVYLLLTPALVLAQDQDMMPMNQDQMSMGDSLVWRMAPMDMSMPMMPGLENELPITAPFLPGSGMDPMMFPEGIPRQVVFMADGDTLHLEASLIRRTIGDKMFVMYGYNRQYPGPLIRADRGSTVVVEFTNNIKMPTTVHWHGLRLDNRFDGVPEVTQAPVRNGESFTYEVYFRDTGIYWYHPHMREDIQQDLGLYGNMLVDPLEEDYYPPVNREEVVILDDILMDASGLYPFGESAATHALMGRFGNVMLVNGETSYDLVVDKGSVVRFFLTNVANSRTFNVVFDGAPIKIVASDVSKFEHDAWITSVVIAPAERYVVDVRFPESRSYSMTNTIQAINHFRGEFYPHIDTLGTINVGSSAADPDLRESFASLRTNIDVTADIDTFRPYFNKEIDYEINMIVEVENLPLPIVRLMEIDTLYVPPMEWNDAMPMMNWLSSADQVHWILEDVATGRRNMDIGWVFQQGDIKKIRLFNNPKSFHPMNHPFHMHGQRFLVLSLDGVPNTNLVWKDTAIVPVGSTMDILLDASNPGKWMAHCHISEHLHAGMMMMFEVLQSEAAQ
ncbi:MAG: multicopper oxidase family protein [Bacteroidetes bacterium]|nr:multicopper oxidase family protein [Bacteroidota bacterium]